MQATIKLHLDDQQGELSLQFSEASQSFAPITIGPNTKAVTSRAIIQAGENLSAKIGIPSLMMADAELMADYFDNLSQNLCVECTVTDKGIKTISIANL
jgi:hypothetical protein